MEWNGMEWYGMYVCMNWNAMEWNGMVWYGMYVWIGMEWNVWMNLCIMIQISKFRVFKHHMKCWSKSGLHLACLFFAAGLISGTLGSDPTFYFFPMVTAFIFIIWYIYICIYIYMYISPLIINTIDTYHDTYHWAATLALAAPWGASSPGHHMVPIPAIFP